MWCRTCLQSQVQVQRQCSNECTHLNDLSRTRRVKWPKTKSRAAQDVRSHDQCGAVVQWLLVFMVYVRLHEHAIKYVRVFRQYCVYAF